MAMLAEPRKRQKLSVNPRGNTWVNDDSKIGQKLMERMGWTKGKGLGANEDGRQESVKVKFKDDNKGVGCSKNYADTWIAHQDDFNSLLADLNNNVDAKQESVKMTSLEEKSKSSKKRVHYHKFTKGKDLSTRSEHELNCIFGIKKSKLKKNNSIESEVLDNDKHLSQEKETVENTGLVTVTSTSSIQEYFEKKMAAKLKNSSKINLLNVESNSDESKKLVADIEKCTEDTFTHKKMKKKKKKSEKIKKEEKDCTADHNNESEDRSEIKSKKRKRKVDEAEKVLNNGDVSSNEENKCRSRRKKKCVPFDLAGELECEKVDSVQQADDTVQVSEVSRTSKKSKKKNKNKNKEKDEVEVLRKEISDENKEESLSGQSDVCENSLKNISVTSGEETNGNSEFKDSDDLSELTTDSLKEAETKKKTKKRKNKPLDVEKNDEFLSSDVDNISNETTVPKTEGNDVLPVNTAPNVKSDTVGNKYANCFGVEKTNHFETKSGLSMNEDVIDEIVNKFKGSNLKCVTGYGSTFTHKNRF